MGVRDCNFCPTWSPEDDHSMDAVMADWESEEFVQSLKGLFKFNPDPIAIPRWRC